MSKYAAILRNLHNPACAEILDRAEMEILKLEMATRKTLISFAREEVKKTRVNCRTTVQYCMALEMLDNTETSGWYSLDKIVHLIERHSGYVYSPLTVYGAINRLENDGCVTGKWEFEMKQWKLEVRDLPEVFRKIDFRPPE